MQISAHVGDMLYCDNPSALQSDMNSRGELIWMQIGGVDYFELNSKKTKVLQSARIPLPKKSCFCIYMTVFAIAQSLFLN